MVVKIQIPIITLVVAVVVVIGLYVCAVDMEQGCIGNVYTFDIALTSHNAVVDTITVVVGNGQLLGDALDTTTRGTIIIWILVAHSGVGGAVDDGTRTH